MATHSDQPCGLIILSFIKSHFRISSVIYNQGSIYSTVVSVFFLLSQLFCEAAKHEIYIIWCQYSYHRKLHLIKLTYQTVISSHLAMEVIPKM